MSIKSLSRDFAFYGLLDFLQRSLGIILIPIYTRVLTQKNYGDLDLILTVFSALTVLVDLQFVAGISRFYLMHRRTGEGPRFLGTALLTRAALGSVIAAVFLVLGYAGHLEMKFIPSFLANRSAWTLVAVGIPVTFVYDILLVQAQMLRWKRWFFAGALGNTVLTTALCVVFTILVPLGIVGVVLGQLLGKVAAACVLFVGLRREISFRYQKQLLTELARYTLPLVPGWWIGFSSSYVGRFFIYAGQGAKENAILSITTKLAAMLGLFCVGFRTAWQPLAMSYIGDERGEEFYVRSLRLFMAGGALSVFGLTVLCKPILTILAPRSYGVAEYYVPFFLIASIVGELDVNLQLGNQISRKTYWISVSSAIAFAINLAILTTLTSRAGIYAAGIGLLASFVAKVTITYFSAQRNYSVHYDRRSMGVFGLGCLALLVLSVGRSLSLINNVVFFANTVALGIVIPWWTLAFSERQAVKHWGVAGLAQINNVRRIRNKE